MGWSMGAERIEVYFTAVDERPKALRVTDGTHTVWLPKSQISVTRLRGPRDPDMAVNLPVWLAKKTGILKTNNRGGRR